MKSRFLIFLFTALLSGGCKKIDKFTQFDMEYNEDVTIPSSTTVDLPFNILCPTVETNSESTFEVNDTRKDLVEKITVTALDLTLLGPAGSDFSFLESISVYISADGLQEVSIASKTAIPDNVGKTLNLELSGADLKEYIKKDHFPCGSTPKPTKLSLPIIASAYIPNFLSMRRCLVNKRTRPLKMLYRSPI